MAIIRCPECNHEISDKAPVCPSCGAPILGHVVRCPECGKVYFSDLQECPQCHHRLGEHEAIAAAEQREVADVTPEITREVPETTQEVPEATQETPEVVLKTHETTPGTTTENVSGKSANTSRNNKIIIAVAIVLAIVLCGVCYAFYHSAQVDRENQAYEYAMASKDPEVLQNYLDQYLDAPMEHRDSIQSHLDMLKMVDQDWTNALVSGSRSAIEQYLAQHPDSPFKSIALHKIDSIDWATASAANTVEAMEMYLEQHPDGEHQDDANNQIKTINSKTLQPDEKVMITGVFNGFFQGLNNKDEDALTSAVNPLLVSFLGKSNATRSDVITFMHKIYKSGVASMSWQSLGDYNINKNEVGDQQYEYAVSFSAIQTVNHDDNSTTETRYKITAKVNSDGRISQLNMVKILD